jgi:hypothetical protein
MDKISMLEAVKRKRGQLKMNEGTEEEALHGEKVPGPIGHGSDMGQGQTALGKEGFDHEEHAGAPENSKPMFHDPKKDTHDAVDLNKHRNMAGDGSNPKYDKMGVDEHKDVRLQSSHLARANAVHAENLKAKSRHQVQSAMNIDDKDASHGEEVEDAFGNHEQEQGFAAPKSKVNKSGKEMASDQDREGANGHEGLYADKEGDGAEEDSDVAPSRGGAMKRARGKLEGFLSKKA